MTCTRCYRKIAASTVEKSYKGEHRQQGEGEGEWEFPCWAKGVCVAGGFAFLWVLLSLLPWPGILTCLRLTLVSPLWISGSLCSLCICASGRSPQSKPWRLTSVPGGEVPGVLLSPSSLCSPHDRPMNLRDKVLRQGIWLFSESWLTQKMADWWLRVTILSRSGCQVLL